MHSNDEPQFLCAMETRKKKKIEMDKRMKTENTEKSESLDCRIQRDRNGTKE